jgi:uncharacterized peroxidase-related enzyme
MPSPEYEILANLARPAPAAVQTNIPVVEESGATGEVAEAYDYFRSNFGRPDVPGILKCFSSSPLLMKQIIAMSSTLLFSDGNLGRRHKEMLASYVSSLNACPYCLDSHAFFLLVHGGETLVSPILDNQLNSVAITLAERSLLDFVRKISEESHRIMPEDVQVLRNAGWKEEQIAESVHVAAAFAFFNRVANAFGLPSQGLLHLDWKTTAAPGTNEA